jgi:hypothetical protein
MDLLVGLAMVDEVTGGKQMERLARGWMGRESATLRRLRAGGAWLLVALAARLDPALTHPSADQQPLAGTPLA